MRKVSLVIRKAQPVGEEIGRVKLSLHPTLGIIGPASFMTNVPIPSYFEHPLTQNWMWKFHMPTFQNQDEHGVRFAGKKLGI